MNTLKSRTTPNLYVYSGGGAAARGRGRYRSMYRASIRSLRSRFDWRRRRILVGRMIRPIGLIIVLLAPALLVADSTRIFALLMLHYGVGSLLGFMKFRRAECRLASLR